MCYDASKARFDRLRNEAERETGSDTSSENPAIIGRVFGNPTVPIRTNVYVSINPADVAGAEIEGASGTITVDGTRVIVVFLTGSKPVVQGDFVVCRFAGNRWIGERLGSPVSGVGIPGCHCTGIPTTLAMTSSKPLSNNRMFQNATFTYGPPPTSLAALNLGVSCFLSTSQFTDYATADEFWYYIGCYQGFYTLTRVYAISHYASPYRDQIRYRWLTGTTGNTCTPFLLSMGAMYAGGDSSCVVTISA